MCLLNSLYANRYLILHLLRSRTQRKHIFRWIKSLQPDYLLDHSIPWLAFDAIDFFKSLPLEGNRVFEYGSGGSTLFWLHHAARVISIEHDLDWYKLLNHRIAGMENIDYRLVLPEPAADKDALDIADPNLYLSEDVLYRGCSFRNYVCQIDSFPDNFFDIVLIDGRARPACIMRSVTKVKVGGALILDNSDREYYLRMTTNLLQDFDRTTFHGMTPGVTWFTETSVFIRRA